MDEDLFIKAPVIHSVGPIKQTYPFGCVLAFSSAHIQLSKSAILARKFWYYDERMAFSAHQ